jgi:dTDP-4-amino-4,6-dideoxygalactose transaminase
VTPGSPESAARIPFLSLVPGDDRSEVRAAIERVVASGWFVLGPEVEAFESEFARAMGAAHAVGVGTGTDAIALILRALDIGRGDEVITTPLSAAYTALAIMMTGARPVFVDIDPARFTLDPNQVDQAIGPRTRAILPVHLYGQPADMAAIEQVATRHALPIVEDRRQAFGRPPQSARRNDRHCRRVQLLSDEESWRAPATAALSSRTIPRWCESGVANAPERTVSSACGRELAPR